MPKVKITKSDIVKIHNALSGNVKVLEHLDGIMTELKATDYLTRPSGLWAQTFEARDIAGRIREKI